MYVSVDVITHECIVIIGDVMMSGCMANCTGVDIAMIVCTVTVIGSVYHGFNVTQHEMYDPPLAASRWRVDPGINVVGIVNFGTDVAFLWQNVIGAVVVVAVGVVLSGGAHDAAAS